MKQHAIIPIFIPHLGCPNDCVFCNQRKITAHTGAPTTNEVRKTIDTWLATLGEVPTIEVAFYGGSFTGLDMDEQSSPDPPDRKVRKRYDCPLPGPCPAG